MLANFIHIARNAHARRVRLCVRVLATICTRWFLFFFQLLSFEYVREKQKKARYKTLSEPSPLTASIVSILHNDEIINDLRFVNGSANWRRYLFSFYSILCKRLSAIFCYTRRRKRLRYLGETLSRSQWRKLQQFLILTLYLHDWKHTIFVFTRFHGPSGVPQGTVLLFNIFINDLSGTIINP